MKRKKLKNCLKGFKYISVEEQLSRISKVLGSITSTEKKKNNDKIKNVYKIKINKKTNYFKIIFDRKEGERGEERRSKKTKMKDKTYVSKYSFLGGMRFSLFPCQGCFM